MTEEQNVWLRLMQKWADADDKKAKDPAPSKGGADL